MCKQVTFLGHVLTPDGVQPNPENVEKILDWEAPKNVKQIQSYLGMANYYRRFIPNFSALSRPLVELTKKGKIFQWTDQCQTVFEKIKMLLTNAPIMAHPQNSGLYILDTDACDVSIGAVLSQIQDGTEKVIAYGSKSLNKHEKNYCVTDRELLAVRHFTEHFRSYLLGRKFLIRTDHQALKWLFTMKEPKCRIARWIEALSEFNFEIEHRSGVKHGNADGMSRCPNPWECECKNLENLRCGPCRKCRRKNEMMCGTLPGTTQQTELLPNVQSSDDADSGGLLRIRATNYNLRSSWPKSVDLQKKQQNDPDVGPVYRWKLEGKRPTSQQIRLSSAATRHYLLYWNSLTIVNGILHKQFYNNDGTQDHLQIIVPRNLKEHVLHEMHNALLSGHLGERKTRMKILQRFFWFGLRNDVTLWIRQCDVCKKTKGSVTKTRGPLGKMQCGAPWDRLSTDILGPLPESHKGNKYILVVTDYFTKWVEIFPIPDQQAETCATLILNEVISRYGCPYDLHTDQGRNFTSGIFEELCKMLNIRKTRTSPYHPIGNGQVERFNKTIIQMIKAYLKGEQKDWDKYLGCLAGAYRASVHESTGFTPNQLMFGRENRMPVDLMYSLLPSEELSYEDFVQRFKKKTERAYDIARSHLQKGAELQKETYDAKSTLIKYSVGDLVWYQSPGEEIKIVPKLRRKLTGPVVVTKKYDDLLYQIQLSKKDYRNVHHNRLLPYRGRDIPGWIKNVKKLGKII